MLFQRQLQTGLELLHASTQILKWILELKLLSASIYSYTSLMFMHLNTDAWVVIAGSQMTIH